MYPVKNTDYSSSYKYGESYTSCTSVRKEERDAQGKAAEGAPQAASGSGNTEAAGSLQENKKENKKEKTEKETDFFTQLQKKQEEEDVSGIQKLIERMKSESQAIKDAFDKKKQKNLYDATADLMAIANAEEEASLRTIHTRLLFKARMLRSSGASSGEIKVALTKIKKVIGKVKAKIKNLQKEEEIDKKRERAEKAKQRKMEEELRRELEMRRNVRKKREKKDVEESRMGMGANYGGPAGNDTASMQSAGGSVISSISPEGAALADETLLSADAMMGAGEAPVIN